MSMRARINAATPLICVIVFLILGFCFNAWHPGWVVFFAIPIVPILFGLKSFRAIYPAITVIGYLVLGFCFNAWHPGWIIFLTIPVIEIIFPNKRRKKVVVVE